VGDVKAAGQKNEVGLGMKPRESGSPDPWISRGRRFRRDNIGISVFELEISLIESIPLADFAFPDGSNEAFFFGLCEAGMLRRQPQKQNHRNRNRNAFDKIRFHIYRLDLFYLAGSCGLRGENDILVELNGAVQWKQFLRFRSVELSRQESFLLFEGIQFLA
jgi:hypothetical protein